VSGTHRELWLESWPLVSISHEACLFSGKLTCLPALALVSCSGTGDADGQSITIRTTGSTDGSSALITLPMRHRRATRHPCRSRLHLRRVAASVTTAVAPITPSRSHHSRPRTRRRPPIVARGVAPMRSPVTDRRRAPSVSRRADANATPLHLASMGAQRIGGRQPPRRDGTALRSRRRVGEPRLLGAECDRAFAERSRWRSVTS
jgi:hypothetical protein